MNDMPSLLNDLLAQGPEGQRELVRARLRVDVAEDLLLRMEALAMTKAQLAAALGVSRSAVSQALTGSRNMSLNTLADMAAALGLRPQVLLQPAATAAPQVLPAQTGGAPVMPLAPMHLPVQPIMVATVGSAWPGDAPPQPGASW